MTQSLFTVLAGVLTVSNTYLFMIEAESVPIRVNCGSNQDTTINNNLWDADRNIVGDGGHTFSSGVSIDSNEELHQKWRTRWSPGIEYSFILDSPGVYTINLYFAEHSDNRRKMNIVINGDVVDTDVHPFGETGGFYKELVKSYTISIPTTTLDILIESTENLWAILSAIEVLGASSIDGKSVYINCGSSTNFIDTDGNVWISDDLFITSPAGEGGVWSTEDAIEGTFKDVIYQTERWSWGSSLTHTIPAGTVIPGSYNVKVYFAEIYFTTVGSRVFDVKVQDQVVSTALDIFDQVGHDKPLVLEFGPYVVTETTDIVVELVKITENVKISGISVVSTDQTVPAPSPPPTYPPVVLTGVSSWQTSASLPVALGELSAISLDPNEYYLFGGQTPAGGDSSKIYKYTLSTDTWSDIGSVANFAKGNHQTQQTLNGLIYTFGGSDPTYSHYMRSYNPVTDIWTQLAPCIVNGIPYGPLSASSALIGNIIYVAGGILGGDEGNTVDTLVGYNINTDTWITTLSSMPDNGRNHGAGIGYNGLFYIFGGRQGGNVPDWGFIESYVYDPLLDIWSVLSPMPIGSGGAGQAVILDNKLIVIGGETCCETVGEVQVYDVISDTWSNLDNMITSRHGIAPVVIGNYQICVAGGGTEAGFSQSKIHECFVFS